MLNREEHLTSIEGQTLRYSSLRLRAAALQVPQSEVLSGTSISEKKGVRLEIPSVTPLLLITFSFLLNDGDDHPDHGHGHAPVPLQWAHGFPSLPHRNAGFHQPADDSYPGWPFYHPLL